MIRFTAVFMVVLMFGLVNLNHRLNNVTLDPY